MKYLFWKTEDDRYYYSTESSLELEKGTPARSDQAPVVSASVVASANFWKALNLFRFDCGLPEMRSSLNRPALPEGEIIKWGRLPDFIHRDYSATLAKSKIAPLLQSLAVCQGSIVDMATLNNGFSEQDVRHWEMFLKLKFRTQNDLDRFHGMGFVTEVPPNVTGQ